MIASHVLTIILLAPLAGSIVIMLLPRPRLFAQRFTAAVATFITLFCAVALWIYYLGHNTGQLAFEEKYSWLPALGVSYHVGVDGVSVSLLALTAIIVFCGVFASWTVTHRAKEFLALLLLLVTGVFGVFMAQDLLFFFLFYEIAVLPMYLLIGIWGTGPKEYSAMKLTLYLLVGSAFMLVGIFALYFVAGLHTFDMPTLATLRHSLDPAFQRIAFFLLYIGFGILAGIFPLHTWSPDGHASAPTAVSMLHAGVLMKLGAYGILRIGIGLLPDGIAFWAPLVAIIAVINIAYGAYVAMGQWDLKYVIAYSSVSHMGVVMLGCAALNSVSLNGAVMQMFSHGIMTGLFFALVGLIYEKSHTRDINAMGGFARRMPGIAVAFTLGGLASFGVPGTSGFVAELLVFLGTWRRYPILAALAVVAVVITATYVLRVIQRVFHGPMDEKRFRELPDARTTEWVALVFLGGMLILIGLAPSLLTDIIGSSLWPYLK